jgi:hypothetical protein
MSPLPKHIQSSSDFGGEKGEGYLSSEPIVAEGG